MGQQHVGILLNSSMCRGIPTRKTGQESLSNYEEMANEYELTPCFFKLGDIDIKRNIVVAYVGNGREYVKQIIEIPKVIHNRALYSNHTAHQKLKRLSAGGTKLFNMNNRYGKDIIHRLVWSAPHLRDYVPNAASATPYSIKIMMARFSDLILKPVRGSVGQGIMRLRRDPKGWLFMYTSHRRLKTIKLQGQQLPKWVQRHLSVTPYLIQERIPLIEYEHRCIDLRVTVQRGLEGDWGITGLFAKAAPQGSFISNVAKGGEAFPAEYILSQLMTPEQMLISLTHVKTLALGIATHLSSKLPLLGDLGLDIGLTKDGRPFFIECNGRDQRYGFRKAGLSDTWKETYRQPMAFARYLLDQNAK